MRDLSMCTASASTALDAELHDDAGNPDKLDTGEKLAACSLVVWQRVASRHSKEPLSLLGDLSAPGDLHQAGSQD